MSYTIRFTAKAEQQLTEAADWYEDSQKGLGLRFITAAQDAAQRILSNPLGYKLIRVEKPIRVIVLHKFPYAMFYTISDNNIKIIACFHQRRNPSEWQKELD